MDKQDLTMHLLQKGMGGATMEKMRPEEIRPLDERIRIESADELDGDDKKRIMEILATSYFTDQQRTALMGRLNLDGNGKQTLRAVGEVLNVSKERTRQIQNEALEGLRAVLQHPDLLREAPFPQTFLVDIRRWTDWENAEYEQVRSRVRWALKHHESVFTPDERLVLNGRLNLDGNGAKNIKQLQAEIGKKTAILGIWLGAMSKLAEIKDGLRKDEDTR